MKGGRVAACRVHDIHVSLLRKYRYGPQTGQDEFQVLRGHRLYTRVQNIGARTEPSRYIPWLRKFTLDEDFKLSVSEKRSN
jgi:hypothetical protein